MENKDIIVKNGIKLGEGRYRTAYELNGYVYKVDNTKNHSSNMYEYNIFNKCTNVFNTIYDKNDNFEILKVDKCISLEEFINSNSRFKVTRFKLMNIWSIFDVVREYEIGNYMSVTVDDIKSICNSYKLDYDEIIYPLNWGFSPSKNTLVILDYAE